MGLLLAAVGGNGLPERTMATSPDSGGRMVRIHYHRYDGDYEGAGLWVWDASGRPHPEGRELSPSGQSDFGPFFEFDPREICSHEGPLRVGFLPRLRGDWSTKDDGDRFWTPEMGEEAWLIGGEPEVHAIRPDIAPQVRAAWIDGDRLLRVWLTHGMALGLLVPRNFQVRCADGSMPGVEAVRALDVMPGKARWLELTVDTALPVRTETVVLAEGYRPGAALPRGILFDREHFFTDVDMGPVYSGEGTTFRLFSPTARNAQVVLYDNATGEQGRTVHGMEDRGRGLWEAAVAGDLRGRHYTVRTDAEGNGAGREVVDIHSRCNTGHDGRGRIEDLRALDPEGFRPVRRPPFSGNPADAVIYEVHLRDFTIDSSSGVPAELRGKYTGAALRGTRIPETHMTTGLDHLLELGVTHVQLLPVQDFDNMEDGNEYNWGYMTACFNSPDGWYASNHRDGSRVREFKQLVQAFHEAGLRVVLDVVYNHTAPWAGFESIAPVYYHRRREDGTFCNGSGTGNEFRSEAPMARKFIVDSCRYWVEEYGVDGFRFDLMGLIDLGTMLEVRDELHRMDDTLLVYGEPWAATGREGTCVQEISTKHRIAGTGIGAFNDHYRDALKGSPDGSDPGYVQGGAHRDAVRAGLAGAIHDWAAKPAEAIQYVTCHDNLTLWDKLVLSAPDTTEEQRLRMQMLAAGILAVSQGVLFLHAGHELARTKGGNHNSYNAPDEVNRLDWNRKQRYHELFDFVRGVIALRREHPLFRLGNRAEIERRLRFEEEGLPHRSCLALVLDGRDLPGETWGAARVFLNPTGKDREFQLPENDGWKVFVQGTWAGTEPFGEARGSILVPGSGMALVARPE